MIKRDADFYSQILRSAFLEIRSLSDDQLPYARKIADIVHNVPGLFRGAYDAEYAEKTWERLMETAKHHGLTDLVLAWEAYSYREQDS